MLLSLNDTMSGKAWAKLLRLSRNAENTCKFCLGTSETKGSAKITVLLRWIGKGDGKKAIYVYLLSEGKQSPNWPVLHLIQYRQREGMGIFIKVK